jgi:hypothetical protein
MDHRPILDRLTGLQIEQKEALEKIKLVEPPEEEIQGLKYRKGEKLLDTVTGKEVTVLAGKRAFGTVPGPKGS